MLPFKSLLHSLVQIFSAAVCSWHNFYRLRNQSNTVRSAIIKAVFGQDLLSLCFNRCCQTNTLMFVAFNVPLSFFMSFLGFQTCSYRCLKQEIWLPLCRVLSLFIFTLAVLQLSWEK